MEPVRRRRAMALTIAVVVSATVLFGVTSIRTGTPASLLPPGPWVERQVELRGTPTLPSCWFVNSSEVSDRFCLALNETPAGYSLGRLFDHGPGTAAFPLHLAGGPLGLLACASSGTWVSSDGTGSLIWNFTTEATIGALA